MFSIIGSANKTSVGINTYLVDTKTELNTIKTKPGSRAYVINTGTTYILSHAGIWEEYYPALKTYINNKLSQLNIDPGLLDELHILLDQIENGDINQIIIDTIESMQLVSSQDIEEILQKKDYISYNDENIILYGGSPTEI